MQQSPGDAQLGGAGIRIECSPGIGLEQRGLGGSGGHWAVPGWRGGRRGVPALVIQPLWRTHRCSAQLPLVPTGTFACPQPVSPGPCLIPAPGITAPGALGPQPSAGGAPNICPSQDAVSEPCPQIWSVRHSRWPAPLCPCPRGSVPPHGVPPASAGLSGLLVPPELPVFRGLGFPVLGQPFGCPLSPSPIAPGQRDPLWGLSLWGSPRFKPPQDPHGVGLASQVRMSKY